MKPKNTLIRQNSSEQSSKDFLSRIDMKKISLNKALCIILVLCFLDLTITYFALQRQMQKYPDSWREKELSFTVGPLLRYTDLPVAQSLVIGMFINSAIYIVILRMTRSEFVYGILFGGIMLAVLSNARIAWMT